MYKFLFFIAIAITLSACSGSTAKGIKGILGRKDCHGGCTKKMPCEGKEFKVEMMLSGNNVLTSGNTLFVRDPDDYDHTLRIEFDAAVPIDVYSNIKDPANKRFVVKGIIEGYDQYVHEKCYRSYILKVKNKEDFTVHTK